jgi:hypothetical protein
MYWGQFAERLKIFKQIIIFGLSCDKSRDIHHNVNPTHATLKLEMTSRFATETPPKQKSLAFVVTVSDRLLQLTVLSRTVLVDENRIIIV